jgi:hypothetical protein
VDRTRDLDLTPLTGRAGVRDRARVVAADHLSLMGSTVAALVVLVPLVVLVALAATGNATDAGGLVLLVGCLVGGLYAVSDVWRKAGPAAALGAFARANGLVLQRSAAAPHYAGSVFADGSHVVRQSVRTPEEDFVEVGDRFPAPRGGARRVQRPALFLRARLSGRAAGGPTARGLVPRELHDAIERFAGPYRIEVAGDELTLLGTRELEAARPGRVQEAFALLDRLVELAESRLLPSPGSTAEPTPSGIPVPELPRPTALRGRRRGPLRVVGMTLALLVVGPLVLAVVMSVVDDQLRGNEGVARLVVGLVVAAMLVAVAWVARTVTTPRPDRTEGHRDAG